MFDAHRNVSKKEFEDRLMAFKKFLDMEEKDENDKEEEGIPSST